jgi:hypothetical protein
MMQPNPMRASAGLGAGPALAVRAGLFVDW